MATIVAFHFSSGVPTLLAMPYRFLLIAATLAVAGCNNTVAEKPVKPRQQLVAEARARLNKGPVLRTHKVDGGEFKVVDMPVSGFGGLTVRTQQCIVWRDAEYRMSTMSCPHPPEPTLDLDGPDLGPADNAP